MFQAMSEVSEWSTKIFHFLYAPNVRKKTKKVSNRSCYCNVSSYRHVIPSGPWHVGAHASTRARVPHSVVAKAESRPRPPPQFTQLCRTEWQERTNSKRADPWYEGKEVGISGAFCFKTLNILSDNKVFVFTRQAVVFTADKMIQYRNISCSRCKFSGRFINIFSKPFQCRCSHFDINGACVCRQLHHPWLPRTYGMYEKSCVITSSSPCL